MDKSILHLLLGSCWLPVSFQVQTEVLVINYEVLGDRATQQPQDVKHNGSIFLWTLDTVKLLTSLKYSLLTIPSAQHPQWQPSGFTSLVKVSGPGASPKGPSEHGHPPWGVSLDKASWIWLFYDSSSGWFPQECSLEKSNNSSSKLQHEQRFYR